MSDTNDNKTKFFGNISKSPNKNKINIIKEIVAKKKKDDKKIIQLLSEDYLDLKAKQERLKDRLFSRGEFYNDCSAEKSLEKIYTEENIKIQRDNISQCNKQINTCKKQICEEEELLKDMKAKLVTSEQQLKKNEEDCLLLNLLEGGKLKDEGAILNGMSISKAREINTENKKNINQNINYYKQEIKKSEEFIEKSKNYIVKLKNTIKEAEAFINRVEKAEMTKEKLINLKANIDAERNSLEKKDELLDNYVRELLKLKNDKKNETGETLLKQKIEILKQNIETSKQKIKKYEANINFLIQNDPDLKASLDECKPERNSNVLITKPKLTHEKFKKFENKDEIELKTKNPHKYDCLGWALSDILGEKVYLQFRPGGVPEGSNVDEIIESIQQAMCNELNTMKELEVQCIESSQLKKYQKKVNQANSHSVIIAMRVGGEWKRIASNGYVWSSGYHFMKYSQDSNGYASWTHKWDAEGKYKLLGNLSPEDDKAWVYNTQHERLEPLDKNASKTSLGIAKSVLLSWDNYYLSENCYTSENCSIVSTGKLDGSNLIFLESTYLNTQRVLPLVFENAKEQPDIGKKVTIEVVKDKKTCMNLKFGDGDTVVKAYVPRCEWSKPRLISNNDISLNLNIIGNLTYDKSKYNIGTMSVVFKLPERPTDVVLHDKPYTENDWFRKHDYENLFHYQVVKEGKDAIPISTKLMGQHDKLSYFHIFGTDKEKGIALQIVFDTSNLIEENQICMCHIPYISKTKYIYVDASDLYNIGYKNRTKSVGRFSKIQEKNEKHKKTKK